ncbi:MAG: hypothetical protein CVT65_04015 [Actinobacteria bacterium HGW-Actinobacteria-5]|nr:MAG: hypothetical protein CVT65_04015 [Actinobacteria bacterium HGW-Actinobacteria-5]
MQNLTGTEITLPNGVPKVSRDPAQQRLGRTTCRLDFAGQFGQEFNSGGKYLQMLFHLWPCESHPIITVDHLDDSA